MPTLGPPLSERLSLLRARLRPDPARPPRVWMRERWLSLLGLAAVVLSVAVADAWLYTCGFQGCPTPTEIRAYRPAEGGRILDRGGTVLGRLRQVRRVNVPLARVPAHVKAAFIATEDRRFYAHRGVDWRGVLRAVAVDLRHLSFREGFSTITMQAARNTFAVERMGERSIARKLIELRLSRLMERALTKDQILELYVNVIYLGNGVYGVEAASRDLFGRSVDQVDLAQGAVLAALPKGPSAYTPRRAPQRALRRRNLVLALMAREGYITPDRARRAAAERLVVQKNEWRPGGPGESYALDAVRAFVDSLREAHGIESKDLLVTTTLDLKAQQAAERAVRRRADVIESESRRDGIEGAMVALDPRTGDVRALVGGRRYERGNFNRALNARRQPGSAFKPFVFAAALGAGMTPATEVDDEPIEVATGGRVWRPQNFDDEYLGRTTLRRALTKSANAATIRVSRSVGEPRVADVARRNGIGSELGTLPSIALGSYEVTPLELVAAYAPFANGGWRVRPRLVTKVAAPDGTVLWTSQPERQQVMDPRDAFLLTSMLRSVVDEGTGRAVRDYGVRGPVAGKTGTTNAGTDVWFVGYTPTLVAGFWFGLDEPQSLGRASGGRHAAPAWAEFYQAGWRGGDSGREWAPPEGLVRRTIDAGTGYLATEWCPWTRQEWFKAGSEPTGHCPTHTSPPEPEPWWGEPIPPSSEGGEPAADVGRAVGREAQRAGRRIEKAFKKIFKF